MIPEKGEHHGSDVHHLAKDVWRPAFHGDEEDPRHHYKHLDEGDDEEEGPYHHYDHADGIPEEDLENETKGKLQPK